MDELARDLYRQFNKQELITVAKELDIETQGKQSSTLVKLSLADLEGTGVPELDDCTDLMMEFLLAAGYINEDGEFLEEGEEVEPESSDETDEDEIDEADYPECFSLADERDPACNRCRLLEICKEARINNRPECFGQMYDANVDECKVCIEAPFCKES